MARVHTPEEDGARLSPMWAGSIVAALLVAAILAATSATLILGSFRPVGEGKLLAGEARTSAESLVELEGRGIESEEAVRRIRNELGIAAAAVLEADGVVSTATSDTLIGSSPVNPMQLTAASESRFTAMAGRLGHPIEIDGVTAFESGDGVYMSTGPLGDGRALLLVYEMSALLDRRAAARTTPRYADALAVAAGIAFALAGVLAVARTRARISHERIARETGFLRRRAADLQSDNEELARARAETERALALAEEKNRIRAEFVLMINHELRTPLTAVVTGARVLQASEGLGRAEQDLVADLVHEGERLDALIGQMLAVARAENRGLTVNPANVEARDLVVRLDSVHRLASLRTCPGFDAEAVTVRTDVTTLSQLVASLVDNAFTHGAAHVDVVLATEPPPGVLHTTSELRPGDVYVLVSDDGPGIEPEFLPRAFEKFEKRSFSSGTGLGLYLARMMAESIGSPIAVATTSEGTTMAIGLPTVRVRERVA